MYIRNVDVCFVDFSRYAKDMFKEDDIDDDLLSLSVINMEKCVTENEILPVGHDKHNNAEEANCGKNGESSLCDSYVAPGVDINTADKDNDMSAGTVLLCAPTGKAAHLLGTKTKLPSYTLHQVNFSYQRWKKEEENKAMRGDKNKIDWKFHEVRALVVDECSLVAVGTFATLLKTLCEDANLQKLVLLGDVKQLPSIEPGSFFTDIFESLKKIGCGVTLFTNHRAGSERIVSNAGLIANKRMPIIDREGCFDQRTLKEMQQNVKPDDDDLILG